MRFINAIRHLIRRLNEMNYTCEILGSARRWASHCTKHVYLLLIVRRGAKNEDLFAEKAPWVENRENSSHFSFAKPLVASRKTRTHVWTSGFRGSRVEKFS